MMNTFFLSWIYWNPDREAFTIPFINHPVRWYGICFAFGFIVGYIIFRNLITTRLKNENKTNTKTNIRETATSLTDQIIWYVILGTIIGARLGHVFFYEWPRYSHDPFSILKIWEGGLASHGGTIGILLALFFYKKWALKDFKEISYINLVDMLSIPTAFAACCIRVGNFVNQEILGITSTLPWAIVFGDPSDGSAILPRHPVQVYEAIAALFTFIFLFGLWKIKSGFIRPGIISGLFFIFIFGSRFFIEFLKLPSSLMLDESFLQTGQLLSLPCVLFGILLLFFGDYKGKKNPLKATNG